MEEVIDSIMDEPICQHTRVVSVSPWYLTLTFHIIWPNKTSE